MNTSRMVLRVVDIKCPICGGENVRSKVCDRDGTWWYKCFERVDHGVMIDQRGKEVEVDGPNRGRWYFNEAGKIDHPELMGEVVIERQEGKPQPLPQKGGS